MATLHWKSGASGSYEDPANWVEGQAPGRGDTALVTGPSPQLYDGGSQQAGETLSGQTILFQNGDTAHPLTGLLSNTVISGDTTINVTGAGTTLIQTYVNNSNLGGAINIGAPGATGRLELGLVGNSRLLPLPVTTNTGTINVTGGSRFQITPYTGGYTGSIGGGPFPDRYAEFDNTGTIAVAPGGVLLDSGATSNLGQYDSSFVNNGTVLISGAEGQGSLGRLNTNVSGNGTIVVDGGNASNASNTGLVLSGNVSGQNITVRDAGVTIESLRNVPRVTSGNLTFQDDNSYLYVIPGDGSIPNGQESVINPLGMTIHGFRAGDEIAFLHEYAFGTESYTPVWDQANHRLTVMVTNSLHPDVSNAAAQFTLDGNYSASDFQVKFVEPLKTGLHPQIDITTTNTANVAGNPQPGNPQSGNPQSGNLPSGSNVGSVYRFFDKLYGTHFFTADAGEKDTVLATRPDLVEETNGFGDVAPSDPNSEPVYRFFDGQYGTHFFTASASEKASVQAARPDLTYEPGSTFYEHAAQQSGDVPVYRFFDSQHGTHFYTGDQNEYNAITTPGSAGFRTDLKYEGIEFYAPAGTFN